MRILLTGANGQVGYCLQRSLVGLGELIPSTRTGHLQLSSGPCLAADLAQPAAVRSLLERAAPDVVINAAAYTAVDRAESEPGNAFRINAEAVALLADACRERGALLVHYSTDYVFSGNASRPWHEDDVAEPLGVYGASKLAGEKAILASGCRHMVFRTAWVYGTRGHNFLRTMLRLARERDGLRVVADQIGAPTPAAWIAQATALALAGRAGQSGIWHIAGDGETSWHGFASAIIEDAAAAGLLERIPQIEAIASRDYPTPATRPAYSVLDTTRIGHDFGIRLPHWREGVRQVIADLAHAFEDG